METTGKLPRSSNIELLRIVTMLLIVAHHYVVNSGFMPVLGTAPTAPQSIFLLLFGAWGKTGINCFVLITGYFMCTSSISWKKFCKLYFEIIFYDLLFYLIFSATSYQDFTPKGLLANLWPIKTIVNSFIPAFLVFYLFIPFLNKIIKNITGREHLLLIIASVFFFCLLPTIPGIKFVINYVSWFIILYFIASFIRLHPEPLFTNKKFILPLLAFAILFAFGSIIFYTTMSQMLGRFRPFNMIGETHRPGALLLSLAIFLFFRNLKINYHPFINKVASTVFGVLLIHANCNAMRTWLWKDTLKSLEMFNSPLLYLHAIISVLAVFSLSSAIDYLRIKFLERKWLEIIDSASQKIGLRLKPYIDKLWLKLGL